MPRSIAILIATLMAIPSFSQTGPHNAASPIVYRAISSDGKRMMTASWYDVAVWNLNDYSLIRSFTIESIGLPLSDDYKFASDPEMKIVWLKAFSKANAAVIDIDKWEYFSAPNENIGFISSNQKGVSWVPSQGDRHCGFEDWRHLQDQGVSRWRLPFDVTRWDNDLFQLREEIQDL